MTTQNLSTVSVPAFLVSQGDRILHDDGEVSIVLTNAHAVGDQSWFTVRDENGSVVRDVKVRSTHDFKILMGV